MPVDFYIRQFQYPADYDSALYLWKSMEVGVTVGRSDTPQEIEKKLERDPDLFLVAEANGKVVGTVIGGYDGRRGMIYHLAVHSEYRKQGIAAALVGEVEERLQAKGCVKCYLLVFADNTEAAEFYKKRGWRHQEENLVFGKEFP